MQVDGANSNLQNLMKNKRKEERVWWSSTLVPGDHMMQTVQYVKTVSHSYRDSPLSHCPPSHSLHHRADRIAHNAASKSIVSYAEDDK